MELSPAADFRPQPFRDARGTGAIVFDPARMGQASAAMLDPAHWGDAATPVSEGGRGAAWFVRGGFGDAVLRHYRRGGLAAKLSRASYVWQGEERVRSLAEFRLLARLRAAGLPVPAPLLAAYWRRGPVYTAAILVERIGGARTLASWLSRAPDEAPWEAIGAVVARMHAAGVEHADLNAHNVLVDAAGAPWIIDFDRGRLQPRPGAWRQHNLERLARSLAKLSRDARWKPGFARLRAAYDGARA